MRVKLWKIGTVLAVVALIGGDQGASASGWRREKRSPHKTHKIIVINEGQGQQNGEEEGWVAPAPLPPQNDGWGAPPPPQQQNGGWGAPPPPQQQNGGWGDQPPPPTQNGGWGAPPQKETIVDHHHHWEVAPPQPPPQTSHSHSSSVRIEINKGGHGGKFKEDAEHLRQFKGEVDATIDAIERDKKEKLDALAQIPHKIASDIDFIGKKIVDDLERNKQKQEGASIQIWKGKGGHSSGGEGGAVASSEETVHHHHYYHDNTQQTPPPPPPPPRRHPPPPPPPPRRHQPPPPPPPRKQYHYGEGEVIEGLSRFAEAGTQFMDFLGGGGHSQSQYRKPVAQSSGEGGWSQGGVLGIGKGFGIQVWKSKELRRRR